MTDLPTRIAELAAKATPGTDWLAHEYSNSSGTGPVMLWDSPYRRNACIECVPRDLAPLLVELLNAVPEILTALRITERVMDEDWLEETISDTLDMDWHPRDAARAIIAALKEST